MNIKIKDAPILSALNGCFEYINEHNLKVADITMNPKTFDNLELEIENAFPLVVKVKNDLSYYAGILLKTSDVCAEKSFIFTHTHGEMPDKTIFVFCQKEGNILINKLDVSMKVHPSWEPIQGVL